MFEMFENEKQIPLFAIFYDKKQDKLGYWLNQKIIRAHLKEIINDWDKYKEKLKDFLNKK